MKTARQILGCLEVAHRQLCLPRNTLALAVAVAFAAGLFIGAFICGLALTRI